MTGLRFGHARSLRGEGPGLSDGARLTMRSFCGLTRTVLLRFPDTDQMDRAKVAGCLRCCGALRREGSP